MAPVATSENYVAPASDVKKYNILEDYQGGYRFAPIEEAQVSRAMIKRWVARNVVDDASPESRIHRYFNTMYERAISDVVIVGAGSAGLSCAYHLASTRPEVSWAIILY
jgi:thiamine thiazole synthase